MAARPDTEASTHHHPDRRKQPAGLAGAPQHALAASAVTDLPATSPLRARLLRGLAWLSIGRVLSAFALLAVPAVLARLLDPAEIGLLEVALGILGMALIVVELGSVPQIVQRRVIDERFLATVFWLNVSLAAVTALVVSASAALLGRLTAVDGRLVALLHGIAVLLVPLSLAIVPRGLLTRAMAFRAVALATVCAGFLAAAAGAVGLRWGVAPAIGAAALAYAVAWPGGLLSATPWRPRRGPDPDLVPPLLRYSVSVSAAALVSDLVLQVERLLILGLLGPAAVGVFSLARSLTRWFLRHLLGIVDGVMLPGLAELQGRPDAARRFYLSAVRAELGLFGPLVITAAVFAREVVLVVFGPGWDETAVVVRLLAFGIWRGITDPSISTLFLSQGRPDLQVRWAALSVVLRAATVLIGAPWGLPGVALSYSVLETIAWAAGHAIANPLIGLTMRRFLAGLAGPARTQLLFLAVLMGLQSGLDRLQLEAAATLVGALAVGLPVYLVLLRSTDRALYGDLATFLRRR